MKKIFTILLIFSLYISNNLFSQNGVHNVSFIVNGDTNHQIYNLRYDKLVVFENDVITIIYKEPTSSNSSVSIIRLDSLTPSLGQASTNEQSPLIILDKNYIKYQFTLSNLKSLNNYHYRIVKRKNPTEKILTTIDETKKTIKTPENDTIVFKKTHILDSTIAQNDGGDTVVLKKTRKFETHTLDSTIVQNNESDTIVFKKTHTLDSTIVQNDSALVDFIVEAHERTYYEVTVGGYFWPNFHLSNYVLVDSTIKDNGPASSSGLIIGGVIFPWGIDQDAMVNYNQHFWRNVYRRIGLFAGIGFSSTSKGFDNAFFGIDFAFQKFNLLFGINGTKVSTLLQGYTVNTYYNKNNDFNSIISSKYIWHPFMGSSMDLYIFKELISTLLGTVIGLFH